jgi:hypothetical protein
VPTYLSLDDDVRLLCLVAVEAAQKKLASACKAVTELECSTMQLNQQASALGIVSSFLGRTEEDRLALSTGQRQALGCALRMFGHTIEKTMATERTLLIGTDQSEERLLDVKRILRQIDEQYEIDSTVAIDVEALRPKPGSGETVTFTAPGREPVTLTARD